MNETFHNSNTQTKLLCRILPTSSIDVNWIICISPADFRQLQCVSFSLTMYIYIYSSSLVFFSKESGRMLDSNRSGSLLSEQNNEGRNENYTSISFFVDRETFYRLSEGVRETTRNIAAIFIVTTIYLEENMWLKVVSKSFVREQYFMSFKLRQTFSRHNVVENNISRVVQFSFTYNFF